MLQAEAFGDFRDVLRIGAGAMSLVLLSRNALQHFIDAAEDGDTLAKAVILATAQLFQRIIERPLDRPSPCLLCGGKISHRRLPGAIGLLLPYGMDEPPITAR